MSPALVKQRDRRSKARAAGDCPNHMRSVPALYGRKHCEDCLIRLRAYQMKYQAKKRRAR